MISGSKKRNQLQELLCSAEYMKSNTAEIAHTQKYRTVKRISVLKVIYVKDLGFVLKFTLFSSH